jgi:hypothetical protein
MLSLHEEEWNLKCWRENYRYQSLGEVFDIHWDAEFQKIYYLFIVNFLIASF